jgi:hypothetical protein
MERTVTLVATPADTAQALLSAAGVVLTATPDPDGAGPASAVDIGNHFLVWSNLDAKDAYSAADYDLLSMTSPILVLELAVDTETKTVRFHQDGSERWSACFTGDDTGLTVAGRLPVSLERLRSDLGAGKAGEMCHVDAAIPANVFREITGIDTLDGPPVGLMRLSGELPRLGLPIGNHSKPWWRFW